MTFPNFLLLGPPKTGTTALYSFLGHHPGVFLSPIKEPGFFMLEGETPWLTSGQNYQTTNLEAYQSLFLGSERYHARGEASTLYFSSKKAVEGIFRHAPKMRMIAVLRDPSERAYSEYLMLHLIGLDKRSSFIQAVQDELPFVSDISDLIVTNSYIRTGFYHTFLRRYYERFDQNQIHVVFYDDYLNNPHLVVKGIFEFLEIDSKVKIDTSIKMNKSGKPRFNILYKLFADFPLKSNLQKFLPKEFRQKTRAYLRDKALYKPKIDLETRALLIEKYRPEIENLQDLFKRDLTNWLTVDK